MIQGPGTITGFQDGLAIYNSDFSEVIQVTATRNSYDGFLLSGTPSTNNVFQGNVATLNDFAGMSILQGNENTIVNNLVMNNEVGIDLVFADLNKIYANTATSNTSMGISLSGRRRTRSTGTRRWITQLRTCSTESRTATTTAGGAIGSTQRTNRAFSRRQAGRMQRLIKPDALSFRQKGAGVALLSFPIRGAAQALGAGRGE